MSKIPFSAQYEPINTSQKGNDFFQKDVLENLGRDTPVNPDKSFDTTAELNQFIAFLRHRFKELNLTDIDLKTLPNSYFERFIFHNLSTEAAFNEKGGNKTYHETYVYDPKSNKPLWFHHANLTSYEKQLMTEGEGTLRTYNEKDLYTLMYYDFIRDITNPVYEMTGHSIDGFKYHFAMIDENRYGGNPYDLAYKFKDLKQFIWEKYYRLRKEKMQTEEDYTKRYYELQEPGNIPKDAAEREMLKDGPLIPFQKNEAAVEMSLYLQAGSILEEREKEGKEFSPLEEMYFKARDQFERLRKSLINKSSATAGRS